MFILWRLPINKYLKTNILLFYVYIFAKKKTCIIIKDLTNAPMYIFVCNISDWTLLTGQPANPLRAAQTLAINTCILALIRHILSHFPATFLGEQKFEAQNNIVHNAYFSPFVRIPWWVVRSAMETRVEETEAEKKMAFAKSGSAH